jgi:hypothetical protein
MKKLKERLERRANMSQSSSTKSRQLRSRKLSESLKQKAFGGKVDNFNDAKIRKVFTNMG